MSRRLVVWIGKNLSSLLLAFLMAAVVWVTAVVSTDPNEERPFPSLMPIEIVGQDPGLMQIGRGPSQARLTLRAPRSIWDRLTSDPSLVRVWLDLSGAQAGERSYPVQVQIGAAPVQVIKVEPREVELTLEALRSASFAVQLQVAGDPPLGYRKDKASVTPPQVVVSGPEHLVEQVKTVGASLDIRGANETVRRQVNIVAYDENSNPILGLTLAPQAVTVEQPISLLGGYRNVAVRVVTNGQVAVGYWLTNILVTPPNVTLFSSDPARLNQLAGVVETSPIDLTGLSDDVDIRASLQLPEGVSLAGEESVLVRLGIAALEGSLPIALPIEVIGLPPELTASVLPDLVDLLLSGPLPILNNINPASIRVSVNLSGLEPGVYQVAPVVDLLPSQVRAASILPALVEVTILPAPTPTPAPTLPAGIPTPTPTATPTP